MNQTVVASNAISLTRYPDEFHMSTKLDPIDDLVNFVGSLSSIGFLSDLIKERHSLSGISPSERAKLCQPYIVGALDFIDQAFSGPSRTAFLPAYYSILQLVKVYILLSKEINQLPASSKVHGVERSNEKQSRSVLTENILIHQRGTISLWYSAMTEKKIKKKTAISIGSILPYIVNVGAEYEVSFGKKQSMAILKPMHIADGQSVCLEVSLPTDQVLKSSRRLRVFKPGWRQSKGNRIQFYGPKIEDASKFQLYFNDNLDRCMLYQPHGGSYVTPISDGPLLMFEEFPIALLFFYLSSVTRYRPELLARWRDSKEWFVLQASLRHGMLQMLTLFWSYRNLPRQANRLISEFPASSALR